MISRNTPGKNMSVRGQTNVTQEGASDCCKKQFRIKRLHKDAAKESMGGTSLADDWREDGFAVAFSESDATAEKDVVALAKQFEQGAIYRYRWIDEKRMERKTVGALMMDTEETVVVQICDKPEGLKNADST